MPDKDDPVDLNFSNALDRPLPSKTVNNAKGGKATAKKRAALRDMDTDGSGSGGAREGSGRPRTKIQDLQSVLVKLSRGGEDYWQTLHDIAQGEVVGITGGQQLEAIKLALSYLYGKPINREEATIIIDVTKRIAPDLSDEELEAMLNDDSPTG